MSHDGAWAKLDGAAALPLVDHGADVAATLDALLQQAHWHTLLEQTAMRPLSPQDIQRLGALACLHDLGKANRGFWRRQFEGAPIVGHTSETAELFFTALVDDPALAPLLALIEGWECWEHFVAVMAHHGMPLDIYSARGDPSKLKRGHWKTADGYVPLQELSRLLDDVARRFPLAFAGGPPLPGNPPFVALFAGLVTMVDWLGSDMHLFPVAGPHLDRREPLRATSAITAVQSRGLADAAIATAGFAQTFGFPPRGAQAEADNPALGRIALLEAETGSGKTEAAIWRWLRLREQGKVDGLYFALPTRAASVQLHGRIHAVLDRLTDGAIKPVLAVPGYIRAGDEEGEKARDEAGQLLPGFNVTWPDDGPNDGRWAAEHPKRFLAARVAVGTIDQALLSGLQLRHAHFRAAMLARSLLVVDEVHSSDHFMGEVLRAVLRNHVSLGGHALLLSATLTAEMRARMLNPFAQSPDYPPLEEAAQEHYPALSGCDMLPRPVDQSGAADKPVTLSPLPIMTDAEAIAGQAIEAARQGASVLVVRNSVNGAVAVAQAVEAMAPDLAFHAQGISTLHHGRFATDDRRLLDAAVEDAFGKGRDARGRILCGTQTLEQSLDIDADLLITDLAPMDVLLQRIGRLHRHCRDDRGGFSSAKAMILVPEDRDLSTFLSRQKERHGLGPIKDGQGVYPDLLAIEATWRLIEGNPRISIPADNRRLVEQALHPDRAAALQEELGTDWMNHAAALDGTRFAERQTARDCVLDIRAEFTSLLFPKDIAIATRLGAKDRAVMFDPPVAGPFGNIITRTTIPDWMAQGIAADAEPDILEAGEVVRFTLGAHEYAYDRFGLRKV